MLRKQCSVLEDESLRVGMGSLTLIVLPCVILKRLYFCHCSGCIVLCLFMCCHIFVIVLDVLSCTFVCGVVFYLCCD